MGATQTTNNPTKRYRLISSRKSPEQLKPKRTDRFRTTMRSVTLRALAARAQHDSVSSFNGSTTNPSSSITSPNTITTITSQTDTDPYLSDFDYRKLSTLTGLSELKINELHREFLILSHNGRLTFERFRSMLESNSNHQTERLARQTFTLFDKDGNNYLDFAEFIAAYITMEKNEFNLPNKDQPLSSVSSAINPLTRQTTTYYSPQQTRVNTSPMIPPRTQNYSSSYYSQSSDGYVVLTPQYKFR